MASLDFKQAAAWLLGRDNFLILTHVRPDGDTVGCAAALCLALREHGKTAYILSDPNTSGLFTEYVQPLWASPDYAPDTVVAVDIAARSMFHEGAKVWLDRVDLTVDHHPSQEFYAKDTCLDGARAACGELIYDIVRQWGPVSKQVAEPLYMAVSTDCGCFAYGNTTADTHRVAAALIDCGIPLSRLNKIHFRTKSATRLKLEGAIISAMELHDGGETAIAPVTLEMLAAVGAVERDLEDIANLVNQLEGVVTAVTLRELVPGKCKLSVRTDPARVNASNVCALLGGGGHAAAAGATVEGTVEAVKAAVLDAIRQVKAQDKE